MNYHKETLTQLQTFLQARKLKEFLWHFRQIKAYCPSRYRMYLSTAVMLASEEGSCVAFWLSRCLMSPSRLSPRWAASKICSLSRAYSSPCATNSVCATSSVAPVLSSAALSRSLRVKSSRESETARVWQENCSKAQIRKPFHETIYYRAVIAILMRRNYSILL